MSDDEFPEMPCGNCDSGTYAIGAVKHGFETYGKCQSRREALRLAPRCKHDASHICWGARDWIVTADFPVNRDYFTSEV